MKKKDSYTLSVCMIVRNEEAYLARCLRSVAPVADEIIVVDTGSTDGTIAIAQSQGARVLQAQWNDDFSEARNISLENARCDWILWLDADDEIPESSLAQLRDLKKEHPDRVLALWVRNEKPGGTGSDFMQARVFPNRPDLRFERRIHEQIMLSALRAGLKMEQRKILIRHHGYSDPATVREKSHRNIRLLLKEYDPTHPDSVMAIELADSYLMIDQSGEAKRWFLEALKPDGIPPEIASHAYLGLGKIENESGDFSDAEQHLHRALELCPDRPDVLYSLAVTQENRGHLDDAIGSLRRILDMKEQPLTVSVDFREARIKAFLRSERLLCERKRFDETLELSERALKEFPSRPEMRSMHARALLREGKLLDALRGFEQSIQLAAKGNVDAYGGLCYIYCKAGKLDHATQTLATLAPALGATPRFVAFCELLPESVRPQGVVESIDDPERIADEIRYLCAILTQRKV